MDANCFRLDITEQKMQQIDHTRKGNAELNLVKLKDGRIIGALNIIDEFFEVLQGIALTADIVTESDHITPTSNV